MSLLTNLVSYFDLENNVDSHSGNNLTSVGTWSYVSALIGNGPSFNSTDDKLDNQSSSYSLNWSGDYTWSFWTYKPSGASFSGYAADHVTTTGANRRVLFIWDATGSNNLTIYCGGFNAWETFISGSLSTLTWYHWVLIKTGSSWELFRNDVTQGTKVSGTASYVQNKFALGGSVDPNAGGTCIFDAVGLWNRALTSSEVSQLYNGGAGLSYSGLSSGSPTPSRLMMMGVGA
jgi:hypothetical protein